MQAVGEDTAEDSSVKDEVQTRKRADSVTSECSLHIEHSHAGGLVNIRDALKFSLLFWAITASSFFHRKFWKFDGNFKNGNLHGISVDLPNAYKS